MRFPTKIACSGICWLRQYESAQDLPVVLAFAPDTHVKLVIHQVGDAETDSLRDGARAECRWRSRAAKDSIPAKVKTRPKVTTPANFGRRRQANQARDRFARGEPTRVAIGGGPNFRLGPMAERATSRRESDWLRSVIVNEPRGPTSSSGIVQEPSDPACVAGVIFFNNVGYIGMRAGSIGLATTLAHLWGPQSGSYALK